MNGEGLGRQAVSALLERLYAASKRPELLPYERAGLAELIAVANRRCTEGLCGPVEVEDFQHRGVETLNGIAVRQGTLPVGEKKLRQLLLAAAEVLAFADTWGLLDVVLPEGEEVPEGCESPAGCSRLCSTGKLARRLREAAEER